MISQVYVLNLSKCSDLLLQDISLFCEEPAFIFILHNLNSLGKLQIFLIIFHEVFTLFPCWMIFAIMRLDLTSGIRLYPLSKGRSSCCSTVHMFWISLLTWTCGMFSSHQSHNSAIIFHLSAWEFLPDVLVAPFYIIRVLSIVLQSRHATVIKRENETHL